MKLRINRTYRTLFPRNCPVIEQTADGVLVGTCTFYLPDGHTCPRHGDIRPAVEEKVEEKVEK